MSILSALHQQHGSIDDLAKLPQAMIMQMAQKKQISEDMVAPILSRKAEMMDAVARTKAMQGAGTPQTSVMEQVMAKNAAGEHPQTMPQEAHQTGIAQLPVEEPQYAGGGIVAFADNQDQPVDSNMRQEGESDSDYMRRVRAIQEGGAELFNPSNYNPINKLGDLYNLYQKNIGTPFAEGVKRFTSETPESQKAKFDAASNARKNVSFTDTAPKAETPTVRTEPAKPAPAEPGVKSLVEKPTDKKPQSPLQKATGAPEMPDTKVDPIDALMAKYEKLITGDPAAAKQARQDAFNQRLFQAGLDVMGGQSSNFAQNMSLASKAAQGYGEDVKGLRSEEQAKLTQLAGLGLKGAALKQEAQKLGITAKHYDDWARVQTQQNQIMAGTRSDANQLRADTATENRILNAAKMIAARPENMGLTDEQLYAKATQMVTGKSAQNQFTGFSGRPLK
jgi:Asp-tRNA(Asn)/Glu-tRNA(Gln) amidotransferase C subunit